MKLSAGIGTVAVLGAGTMGQGIARVCAGAGLKTLLYDVRDELITRGIRAVEESLAREFERGKLTAELQTSIRNNILPCASLADLDADLIIEAVVERLDVKQKLFVEVEQVHRTKGREDTIFSTNTSSLSVTSIGSVLINPGLCVGLHFFNPAPLMKLVEVVAGQDTDAACVRRMTEFVKAIGKIPALAKDSPGFIVNRVARPYYVEALKLLEVNACSVEGIDRLLRSAGFKMGPFELMDLIGIDTNFSVTQSLYDSFGHAARFKPSAIQQGKVIAGHLGRKTGRGFYTYEKN